MTIEKAIEETMLERDCMYCERTFADNGAHDYCPTHRNLEPDDLINRLERGAYIATMDQI